MLNTYQRIRNQVQRLHNMDPVTAHDIAEQMLSKPRYAAIFLENYSYLLEKPKPIFQNRLLEMLREEIRPIFAIDKCYNVVEVYEVNDMFTNFERKKIRKVKEPPLMLPPPPPPTMPPPPPPPLPTFTTEPVLSPNGMRRLKSYETIGKSMFGPDFRLMHIAYWRE